LRLLGRSRTEGRNTKTVVTGDRGSDLDRRYQSQIRLVGLDLELIGYQIGLGGLCLLRFGRQARR
jgi:hypothetical protein